MIIRPATKLVASGASLSTGIESQADIVVQPADLISGPAQTYGRENRIADASQRQYQFYRQFRLDNVDNDSFNDEPYATGVGNPDQVSWVNDPDGGDRKVLAITITANPQSGSVGCELSPPARALYCEWEEWWHSDYAHATDEIIFMTQDAGDVGIGLYHTADNTGNVRLSEEVSATYGWSSTVPKGKWIKRAVETYLSSASGSLALYHDTGSGWQEISLGAQVINTGPDDNRLRNVELITRHLGGSPSASNVRYLKNWKLLFNTDSASQPVLINEAFDSTPLPSGGTPWYDDGVAFDLSTMPVTGQPCFRYLWSEGDVASNGLDSLRANFLYADGSSAPQSEFEVEFLFASTSNFGDVAPGTTGPHFIYIRTNLDDQYGDNTTIYLEPDGNGRLWIDLNKSDQPATWQEVRQTVDVDVFDGAVHHVLLRMRANTYGEADGVIKLYVDDVLTIDRDDVEIFIFDNQYFDKISVGPYIISQNGNSAVGDVALYMSDFIVRSITPGVVAEVPGSIEFQQSAYSVTEGTSSLTLTILRGSGSDGTVSINVETYDGTAEAGSDYTAVSQTVTFLDGEVSKTVSISIADDMASEGTEVFYVELNTPGGGASIGSNDTAAVTIYDDESVEAGSLSVDYPISTDGHDDLIFTVSQPSTVGADVSFTYTTYNIGVGGEYAESGTDYAATSGSSSIPAGQLYKQIAVPIAGNNPPSGRHLVGFRVTDSDSAVTEVQGLILRSICAIDVSRPNSVSPTENRTVRWMGTDQSSYSNGWIGSYAGGATVNVDPTSPQGYKSLEMDLSGSQGDRGIGDTSFTPIIGEVTDGKVYYHKWWMKLEDDFRWDADSGQGAGNQVAKAGRMTRPGDLIPGYTTVFLRSQGFYWSPSFPEQDDSAKLYLNFDCDPYHGNVRGSDLVEDLGADVTEWREYIFVEKRNTGRATDDGYVKLYINGQLADQILNTNVTTDYPLPGDGENRVRLNWGGILGRTHPQMVGIGTTPPADSGGKLWVCDIYTTEYWPSVIYPEPS